MRALPTHSFSNNINSFITMLGSLGRDALNLVQKQHFPITTLNLYLKLFLARIAFLTASNVQVMGLNSA